MFGTRTQRPEVSEGTSAPVIVYGTQWCAATMMVRRFLDRSGIPYVFRDMDRDTVATNQVRWWTGGYASHPTVQVGGDILVEPTMDELRATLRRNRLL